MVIKAIKTRKVLPPKDNLNAFLKEHLKTVEENSILVVTSKVVSICEGRCVKISENVTKDDLIKQEAELYIPREVYPMTVHTITRGILIRSAGIDESNGDGHYILYPKDPSLSAKKIWQFIHKEYGVNNFGVIITDSTSVPLKRGIVGISLAHYGFNPLRDYRGTFDIFGRELHLSQSNIPDSLASAVVLEMGEGNEQSPLATITGVKNISFTTKKIRTNKPYSTFIVGMEEDIFSPFWSAVPWKKGGSGNN